MKFVQMMLVVFLLSACSAQPGEMTLGQMAAQANQTAPATSVPSTPTPHVVIVTATPDAPVQPTATPYVIIMTATPEAPTVQLTPMPIEMAGIVPTATAQTLTCADGRTVSVPPGGQVFYATVNGVNGPNDYVVVYDPGQSGAPDITPPSGWWYQPCLPANRIAHEVAVILQPGNYRFIGPECTAWLNHDGQHPFDTGRLLVSRRNVQRLEVPATAGGNESWLFVRCAASDASGFSLAKLPE